MTTITTRHRSTGLLIGAIGAVAMALLMVVWGIVVGTQVESARDVAGVQTYYWIAVAAASLAFVLATTWVARCPSPVSIMFAAVGGGALAGLLMTLYDVVYSDYRGGIVPLWAGTVLVVAVAAAAALLSIGSAFAVFAAGTRFLSRRYIIVSISVAVAAAVGGGAGGVFGRASEPWVYVVVWTLVPALYVAVTFRRLEGKRSKADGGDIAPRGMAHVG